MSRILYVWELGGGYGHIGHFLPLALTLRHRGHEVFFALRDLSHAESIMGHYEFPLFQAPLWLPKVSGLIEPSLSYPEILHRFGFLDPSGLMGLVKAWRSLFEMIRPDLLLLDHAPTALLSSTNIEFPRCLIGTGFFSPPPISPMPNLRPWMNVTQNRLIESEQKVVVVINTVLSKLGARPIHILADLFQVEENFLCTFPEMDHYPMREKKRYRGTVLFMEEGDPPRWPMEGEKKIFAYIKTNYRYFEKLLQALHSLPHRILIHAPRISEEVIKQYQSNHLSFSRNPVQVAKVREECDLVICHAGHGTISATLLAGRPLLLLPIQLEQYILSLTLAQMGATLMANPENPHEGFRMLIDPLLNQPSFTEKARSFANKYAISTHPNNWVPSLTAAKRSSPNPKAIPSSPSDRKRGQTPFHCGILVT